MDRPAYHNDVLVGAIACRLEAKEGGKAKLYIMTLGVLAPYRGEGVGKIEVTLQTDKRTRMGEDGQTQRKRKEDDSFAGKFASSLAHFPLLLIRWVLHI